MVKITAEMLPLGFDDGKYIISKIEIANDGTGSRTVGNYTYKLFDKLGRVIKTGSVKGFHRRRDNVWKLLKLILDQLN